MSMVSYRAKGDIERLTISATGTNRGIIFSELGDELGRIIPTTGELIATEEFEIKADTMPDLLANFIEIVQEGIKEGIAYVLWQCTFAFAMPGNQYKLYVLAHTEELESLVELNMIATKWFGTGKDAEEVAELVLRVPAVLG
jgi:hypothetical protein